MEIIFGGVDKQISLAG